MIDKENFLKNIEMLEKEYSFKEGYKIIILPMGYYRKIRCSIYIIKPWQTTKPNAAQLKILSDERGNSYEVEKNITKSPLT